jgi:hypothetical protein
MRAPLIALSCGLAVAAALLILREGGERREARLAAPAPASAGIAVPAASLPPVPQRQAPTPSTPRAAPAVAAVARPAAAAAAPPPRSEPPPRRTVFALSSDHQTLLQDTPLASADRDLLESEARDDAWATASERLIRDELARHASAADFDIIAVDCRQTLCAIEAFSYGEDGHREWVETMDEAFKEALGGAFTSINTAFPAEGGRAPVLTFLHRRPGGITP